MTCSYFRNHDGEPCYGPRCEGVSPCPGRVVGHLVCADKAGDERWAVCAEHWLMRKGRLGDTTTFEERR